MPRKAHGFLPHEEEEAGRVAGAHKQSVLPPGLVSISAHWRGAGSFITGSRRQEMCDPKKIHFWLQFHRHDEEQALIFFSSFELAGNARVLVCNKTAETPRRSKASCLCVVLAYCAAGPRVHKELLSSFCMLADPMAPLACRWKSLCALPGLVKFWLASIHLLNDFGFSALHSHI